MGESANDHVPGSDATPSGGSGKGLNWLFTLGCLVPIAGIVLIVLLFIGGWIWTSVAGPSEEKMAEEFGTACYNEVRAQLKDPGSANITDTGVSVIDDSGDDPRFELNGTGQAGNSFGGAAGFSFKCTGYYSKSNESATATATVSSN